MLGVGWFFFLSSFTDVICVQHDSISWGDIFIIIIQDHFSCASWLNSCRTLRMIQSSKNEMPNTKFSAKIILLVSWLTCASRSSLSMRWSFTDFANSLDCSRIFACFGVFSKIRCWLGIMSNSVFKLVAFGWKVLHRCITRKLFKLWLDPLVTLGSKRI